MNLCQPMRMGNTRFVISLREYYSTTTLMTIENSSKKKQFQNVINSWALHRTNIFIAIAKLNIRRTGKILNKRLCRPL